MKKILLFASALAGLFLAASCQQENLEPEQMAGTVRFTVEAPGAIATKTIADGQNVDVVHYAVYKTKSDETHAIEVSSERPLAQGFVPMSGKKANINFDLLQDQYYTIIFWAQVSQYDNGQNDYYDLGDLRAISMKKDAENNIVGNEEGRAAFFAWYSFDTKEHRDHKVTLKRPFAQLNLLTTLESLKPVSTGQTSGYEIVVEKSTVTVEGLTSTFYPYAEPVLEGTQGKAEETKETFTFTLEDTPAVQGIGEGDNGDLLYVNDKAYHYVSMNYFFVPVDQYIVNISYALDTDKGNIEHNISSVPVKKNYRTNVIGNLLTKETTFEIVVDAEFDGEEIVNSEDHITVTTIAGLQYAINNAGEGTTYILFANDLVGDVTILQKNNVNLVINGNDKEFDGVITVNGDSRSTGAETLTLKNINFATEGSDFTFINAPSKIGNKYNYSHNVTIEGCTFTGNKTVGSASFTGTYNFVMKNCEATNMHSLLQAQSCDNTVFVENVTVNNCKSGVSFGNTATPTLKNSTINAAVYGVRADANASRGNLVIENTTINATQPVIVRKTTTDGYTVNLSNVTLNTEELYQVVFTSGADDAAYVAPTKTWAINGADSYSVFPRDNYGEKIANGLYKNAKNYYVANAEGLVTLAAQGLQSGDKVSLIADIDLAGVEFNGIDTFHPNNGNEFDGQGHTVSNWTNDSNASDMGFIRRWVGSIKNLTIENASLKTSGRSGIIAGNVYANIDNCHVVNCTLEDSYWACGLIAGLYCSGSVSNCSVTNSSIKSNGGTGAIVGVLNEDAGTRSFTNCVVSGCTVNNTGAYGEVYSAAMVCGMFNNGVATVKFVGCELSNNTKAGQYVGDLYYAADDDTTIVIE